MGDSEAVTEAPPPPTWRVHLCLVSGPEGFDPAPLFNAVSGGTRPLFSLVEPEALLRESKDADLAAELKAWSGNAENAGKDAPAELIVRALAARFAEDKAAGIERKVAPPPEAEGEAAKAVAPAEGEDGEEPFTDEPPPVEKSADVYYVLKGFPRGPADGPAMEASGFPLDSLVTLEMNTADLKATGAAAAEAAAADASAKGGKGKGKEAPKAAAADPEADAEGEDVEPTPLSTPELTVALSLVFGKEGGGFQDTLAVSVSQPAEDWSQPPLLFGKLSAVLYAAAQKKQMYRNHTLTLSVVDVPTVSEPADTTHYRRLLGAAPSHAIGVPYLLHCLIEQVVISTLEANDAASLSAEDELDAIAALLNMEVSEAAVVPQTAARMAVEAAASASEKTLLIPNGDMVAARELRPPPLGTTLEGDSAAQAAAERSLFQGLPRPGKARRSMPSEPSLSSEERGTERTELHHFSRFNPSQIDGSMCLRGLAKLVNGSDPHRGSRGTGWLLADRPWIEELSASAFAQVLTEMRATSHRPARLNSYHARDDVLLYVQHDAVPPERESVEAWRCELYDLVDRKFDAWHKWLMRGDGNEVVPSAPLPPFGGSLYKFDERNADLLVTTTCLYPADHQILRYSMSSRGATCVIEPRNGGYACIARGGGTPAPPARFDISFADHGRAVAAFEEEEWRVTVGGADGLQVSMTCSGVVHLLHPPVYTPIAAAVTPTEAAILQLSGLRVTGAPQADGVEFLLLRVTLGGVDLPEAAAVTSTVPISAEAISWAGQQLSIQLPVGSPRPALLSIELWGREPDKDPDASPLATAELLLPEGTSGALAGALSAPAFAGSEVAISGFFAVEAPSRGEQIAEPLSREVSRSIFATGTIITTLEDGTKRVYHRNGNLAERKVSGPHANCWVCTNTAGLRVGTTAADDQFYVAPVAVSASTDAVTHNVITTRADGTLTLTRADGSRVIQFADGTSIHADKEAVKNPLRGVLQVRCEGSPPVAINLRLGETKVMGLDGTNAKADGQSVAIDHLDGTKLKLGHNGTLEFLPAALAWQVGRASDDPNGVYQLDLAAGTLYTKDPQGSSFSVTLGETHTVDLVLQDELAGSVGEKQDWDDDPDWSHPPRLFICRPDGTGVELLRKTDVAAFLSQRELDSEAGSSMHLREPVMGDTTAEVNTWVWRDWMQQTVQELAAERGNSDVQQLLALLPKIKYEPAKATLLHFRRMLRREPLSSADRAVLETEVAEMEEYRLQEDERAKAMHIVDTRTAGEKTDQLELQAELMKAKGSPVHLSASIESEITGAQEYSARAFQMAQAAKRGERAQDARLDVSTRDLASAAILGAMDDLKPRKTDDVPSKTGGYQQRRPVPIPVGGGVSYADSFAKKDIGPAPALNLAPPSPAATTRADFAKKSAGGAGSTVDSFPTDAAATGGSHSRPPLPHPPVTKTMPSAYPLDMPPMLPPPSNRLTAAIPPRIDGGVRAAKVPAPHVSEQPAAANPNMGNLLLEVPYKRGVHTVSINQRYMNNEPTFDAAFELTPAAAAFGTMKVGYVGRLKLQLTNVSNLAQRFVIKGPRGGNGAVSVVYAPGVVAAGLSVPIEIEVCSQTGAELHEVVTVVTEREEITLPVSAVILDDEAYSEHLQRSGGKQGKGLKLPRILSAEPRDPALAKTVAPRVDEPTLGSKRFHAPPRDLGYTRPDFFAEPPSDDDMEEPH